MNDQEARKALEAGEAAAAKKMATAVMVEAVPADITVAAAKEAGAKSWFPTLSPTHKTYAIYGGLVLAGALVGATAMYLYTRKPAVSTEE